MLACTKNEREEISVENGDVYVADLGSNTGGILGKESTMTSTATISFGESTYNFRSVILLNGVILYQIEKDGVYRNDHPYVILDKDDKYILSCGGDIMYSIKNKDVIYYRQE